MTDFESKNDSSKYILNKSQTQLDNNYNLVKTLTKKCWYKNNILKLCEGQ